MMEYCPTDREKLAWAIAQLEARAERNRTLAKVERGEGSAIMTHWHTVQAEMADIALPYLHEALKGMI